MVTYFCPNCWSKIDQNEIKCPACGYDIANYSKLPYEKQLLLSLKHPIREDRMIAVQILGKLKNEDAVPEFEHLLKTENDFYLLREVLYALSKINSSRSRALILETTKHRSNLVRSFAERMMANTAK